MSCRRRRRRRRPSRIESLRVPTSHTRVRRNSVCVCVCVAARAAAAAAAGRLSGRVFHRDMGIAGMDFGGDEMTDDDDGHLGARSRRPPPPPTTTTDETADEARFVLLQRVLGLFLPLFDRDGAVRAAAVEVICKAVKKSCSELNHKKRNVVGAAVVVVDDPNAALQKCLPLILMHASTCPFEEVRDRFGQLLDMFKENGIKVPKPLSHGPSRFFNTREVIRSPSDEIQTQMLFIDAFLQNNRLDHVTQVMGYHPQYLECFLRTQHFMLRGDGPLPYDYRHYIAMMAAGRHQCSYLINLQKQEFLLQGGDPRWLRGLDHIPQKLRGLYEINKILAHRPWLISRSHIQKLTKGKDSWSLSEVVHAIAILVHFHSLSSFVFGCGINAEIDEESGHSFRPPAKNENGGGGGGVGGGSDSDVSGTSPTISDLESGVEFLMQKMKSLSEQAQEPSLEEMAKRFEKVESQTVEISPGGELLLLPKADISCFIQDPSFTYQDFAKRGEVSDIATFRVQDYSWDDHGFSLVNRLYNDVGTLLDEKFKTAYSLTYYTMGIRQHVDTTMFRRAIWNYIHCMFGIRHDDYDYGEVNQLLERDLKAYVKTVCCYPERTTKKNYDNVMRDFRHSEKVHVNLMMLEARMQAELLYALRAIMQHMT